MKSMNLSLSPRLFALGTVCAFSSAVQTQLSAPKVFQGGLETMTYLYAVSAHPMGSASYA